MSTGEGRLSVIGGKSEEREFDKLTGKYVIKERCISENRIFFQEDDFRSALSYSGKNGNGLTPLIKGLFDEGRAESLEKSSRIKSVNGHVVIIAHTTSMDLSALVKSVQMQNDLANRFLWALVHRGKKVALPKSMPSSEIDKFRKIISARIEEAMELKAVEMTGKARRYWKTIYPGLTMDVSGAVGNVVNLSDIHVLRLALIYALAAGHKKIREEDLKAANALVKYSRESASIIFGGCQSDKRKEKILNLLFGAASHEMTLTEISNAFGRNVKSDELNKILRELEESKLLKVRMELTAGAPKTIFRLASAQSQRTDCSA